MPEPIESAGEVEFHVAEINRVGAIKRHESFGLLRDFIAQNPTHPVWTNGSRYAIAFGKAHAALPQPVRENPQHPLALDEFLASYREHLAKLPAEPPIGQLPPGDAYTTLGPRGPGGMQLDKSSGRRKASRNKHES